MFTIHYPIQLNEKKRLLDLWNEKFIIPALISIAARNVCICNHDFASLSSLYRRSSSM